MRDRGIIFSAPMVRALLAGTKTQTRRLLTRARVFGTPHTPAFTLQGAELARALQGADRFRHLGGDGWLWEADAFDWQAPAERNGWMAHIGYAPGDRLYVRETWKPHSIYAHMRPRDMPVTPVFYAADNRYAPSNTPWVPCIHMPRWASRLWLAVTEVRVQRLQDISEADAIAEGIDEAAIAHFGNPIKAYAGLWDYLHGGESDQSWAANPWIVAVTFDVHRGNIEMEAAAA